jgi:hypothetical protein
MNSQINNTERKFLLRVLMGNEAAADFVVMLGRISQLFDDLYDGDAEVGRERLLAGMFDVLVAMPSNPFYRAYFDQLQPLMASALNDWADANALEQGSAHDRHIAWVIRDNLSAVVSHCALLVGGPSWQRRVSPDIRRFVHDDPFPGLAEEGR